MIQQSSSDTVLTTIRNENKYIESSICNFIRDLLIPKQDTSYIRGRQGEIKIKEILLKNGISYTDTHNNGHSMDLKVEDDIYIEVKNYSRTVPSTEVNKFERDILEILPNIAIFISLNGMRIASHDKLFEINTMTINKHTIYKCYMVMDKGDDLLLIESIHLLKELRDKEIKLKTHPHINHSLKLMSEECEHIMGLTNQCKRIENIAREMSSKITIHHSNIVSLIETIRASIPPKEILQNQVNLLNIMRITDRPAVEKLLTVKDIFQTPLVSTKDKKTIYRGKHDILLVSTEQSTTLRLPISRESTLYDIFTLTQETVEKCIKYMIEYLESIEAEEM